VKCSICKEIIQGNYYEDFWGRKFCLNCYFNLENGDCKSCGFPVTSVKYLDGRKYCARCENASIKSGARLRKELLPKIIEIMHKRVFKNEYEINLENVEIEPCSDRRELSQKNNIRGLATHRHQNDMIEVKILVGGNPLVPTYNTLAHEIGHCWAYQHSINREYFDTPLSEAIAGFFSLTVLSNLSGKEIPRSQNYLLEKNLQSLRKKNNVSCIKNHVEKGRLKELKEELKGKSWIVFPLYDELRNQNRIEIEGFKRV